MTILTSVVPQMACFQIFKLVISQPRPKFALYYGFDALSDSDGDLSEQCEKNGSSGNDFTVLLSSHYYYSTPEEKALSLSLWCPEVILYG